MVKIEKFKEPWIFEVPPILKFNRFWAEYNPENIVQKTP